MKLVIGDLSNIEGRVLAWLAGEDWKLQAYREYDRDPDDKTKDLYVIGYAKSFRMALQAVVDDYEAGGEMRQMGKVQELALGFGGGVGAFVSMAAVYGIDLIEMATRATIEPELWAKSGKAWDKAIEDKRTYDLPERVYRVCWSFVRMWRKANPATESFWYALERAALNAIDGGVTTVGPLVFDRAGAWLRIKLPSGRYLSYPHPKIEDEVGKISYMGMNQYTRRWQRIATYGGKFSENVTQAVARDVLAANLPLIEDAGYPIVLTVHDEVITETPDTDEFNAAELKRLMTTNPAWARGLPLAAGGYETYRYRKD